MKRGLLISAAMAVHALSMWALLTEVTYAPVETYGAPAASIDEISRRFRAYDPSSVIPDGPSPFLRPREFDNDEGYVDCQRWFRNYYAMPPLIGAPSNTPTYDKRIRVRPGLPSVRVIAWVMPNASLSSQAVKRAGDDARPCTAGEQQSDIESGDAERYSMDVAEYRRYGWSGIRIRARGMIGDEDDVAIDNPNLYFVRTYQYETVLVTRGQVVVGLQWDGDPPWYQRTAARRRAGEASVAAILRTLG